MQEHQRQDSGLLSQEGTDFSSYGTCLPLLISPGRGEARESRVETFRPTADWNHLPAMNGYLSVAIVVTESGGM